MSENENERATIIFLNHQIDNRKQMVCVCAPLTLEMYEMNWNWTGAARAETDKQSSYDLMLKQHTFVYFAIECEHVSSIQISRLNFMYVYLPHIVNSRVMWWIQVQGTSTSINTHLLHYKNMLINQSNVFCSYKDYIV